MRKTLGQHEIATVQTTAIDSATGMVNLTTMLAHSSGEWIASDWPVCPAAETANPQRMGAALTYARRYALFTLVGIAGEDDLDAPDLGTPSAPRPVVGSAIVPSPRSGRGSGNGRAGVRTALPVTLDPVQSAILRDQLLSDIEALASADHASSWARNALSSKNTLVAADATRVEEAFEQKLTTLVSTETAPGAAVDASLVLASAPGVATESAGTLAIAKPRRYRSKEHLRYVARQACLICGRQPSDPHHCGLHSRARWGEKPVMSSPSRFVACTIVKSIVLPTNQSGGEPRALIRSASPRHSGTRHAGTGKEAWSPGPLR